MARKDENRPPLSQNIVKFRKAKGLTQIDLAKKSGLSRRMIAHYETNISNPPINNILAIARALNVSLNELLGIKDPAGLSLFEDLDLRILKKIMLIKDLPKSDRVTIYNMIDALLKRNNVQDKVS